MSSKEVLERYYSNLLYGNGGFQTDEEELEGLNTIKKDLERLEQLEKENQELKSKYNDLMLDFKMFDFNTLKQENEKLKKAIEILKERGEINVFISYFTNKLMLDFADAISCVLEPKEYELLKEVLDNA